MEKLVSMKKLVSLGLVFVLAAVLRFPHSLHQQMPRKSFLLAGGVTILLPAIQRLPV